MATDTMPSVGRRPTELDPALADELRHLAIKRRHADYRFWVAVDAAIDAGESKAAIARAVGLSRQALTVRQKSRATEPEPDDET